MPTVDRAAGTSGDSACSPSSRDGSTGGAVCSSSPARCCSTGTRSGRCRRGLEQPSYDRLVWRPDALGSACFLISGYLAYVEVCGGLACRPRRGLEWRIAAVNLAGCVAFGISAVAAYVVPATGGVVDLAAANAFTALGALCFLVGAVLLLPESAPAASS
jgi:hypothetical protein